MPLICRIDPTQGLVVTEVWGRVTDDDVCGHLHQLLHSQQFAPEMDQLVLNRGRVDYQVTAEAVRRVARGNAFGEGSRRAIVTNSPIGYGIARMYALMVNSGYDNQVQVFRAEAPALNWLGLSRDGNVHKSSPATLSQQFAAG